MASCVEKNCFFLFGFSLFLAIVLSAWLFRAFCSYCGFRERWRRRNKLSPTLMNFCRWCCFFSTFFHVCCTASLRRTERVYSFYDPGPRSWKIFLSSSLFLSSFILLSIYLSIWSDLIWLHDPFFFLLTSHSNHPSSSFLLFIYTDTGTKYTYLSRQN